MRPAIATLFDRQEPGAGPLLPGALRAIYGGDLRFPASDGGRPYVIANFVSTLDGVVSFKIPGHSGGATISRADEGDRFIMGLLRASADAVLVGAGTVRDVSADHLWTADYIYPSAARAYDEYRRGVLGKTARFPLTVVVSRSGALDADRAVFRMPAGRALILTTAEGQERLNRSGQPRTGSVEVLSIVAPNGSIAPARILEVLAEAGVRTVLHEGGPALFGAFLAAGAVDEFFLTVAPRMAGRNGGTVRPGVVAGVAFQPEIAPGLSLWSVKQRGDDLYLRYRRSDAKEVVK